MRKMCSALIAVLTLVGCSSGPGALLKQASNATSQVVCSSAFVSGLSPDNAYQLQLRPEPGMGIIDWAVHFDVDNERREVRSYIARGFPSRSVFREGRGCTLVNQTPMPDAIRSGAPGPTLLPEIGGTEVVTPASIGLRTAIDKAFAEPGSVPRATAAIVVVHHGRVIGEHYANGISMETQLDGHSLAKSVVNALVAVLVREKKLDVYIQVTVSEWNESDPRAKITIDNLLRMDAGFDVDEGRGAGTATSMWYTQDDIAHFAAQQPLVSSVGQQWRYSSGSYAILSGILRRTIGGPQALSDFAHREIFDPLGMSRVTIEFDGVGNMMGAHAVYASARDWAKFGLLYLKDGVIGKQRSFPKAGCATQPRQRSRADMVPVSGLTEPIPLYLLGGFTGVCSVRHPMPS